MRELIACTLVRCYPNDRVRRYSLRDQQRSAPARAKYLRIKEQTEGKKPDTGRYL